TGNPAVAFVSDGDIQIAGTVTVKAGKFTGDPDCEGTKGTCETVVVGENTAVICGGGSGAGFGGHGGDPGVSENGTSNFSGGNVSGDADLEPLRGGCESPGFSMFGSAIRAPGGAIQLVSRTKIEILPGGFLDLNGTGGQVHSLGGFAGSGGASGGAALLEAPLVTVAASAGIAANGGGGAGGCANGGDGGLSASRAQGADCSEGDGGDGGAGGTKDGTTGSNATDPLSAGNGGGGAGRIRINTPIGKFLPEGGAIVSPTPSTGTLGTR
ncbi:MAG TPA: hypothetical protein VFG83_13170, partial [Kofleriaceae bacterium]|nr:hypothetical protein [Kofleriaceae bacterium]